MDIIPSKHTSEMRRVNSRIAYSREALAQDMARVHEAWRAFQASRYRDAVYPFLTEVFELVEWWTLERRALERSRRALYAQDVKKIDVSKCNEPFATVIIAAAYPWKVDRRMLSKWSRVLRYALAAKSCDQELTDFIKGKRGLNACAARYAARLRRCSAVRK